MNNKVLILITGESFRLGSQMTRGRGGNESIPRQRLATSSHLKLIQHIKQKYNKESDVMLFTYKLNQECDNMLLELYKPYVLSSSFLDNVMPTEDIFLQHIVNKLKKTTINEYDFIITLRLDIYLKQFFFDKFNLNDNKMIYTHIDPNTCEENNVYHLGVNHAIIIFPNKYLYGFLESGCWTPHAARDKIGKIIGFENIEFMINTAHLLSTDLEWNPLYIQVGRSNNLNWVNKGCILSSDNKKEYSADVVNMYNSILNTDTLEENLSKLI